MYPQLEVQKKVDKGFSYNGFVTVDYNLPLAKMVSEGGYGWVSKKITDENFPPREDEVGIQGRAFRIYVMQEGIKTSDDIIARMEADGYQPVSPRELANFLEANPRVKQWAKIAALGSPMVLASGEKLIVLLMDTFMVVHFFDQPWNSRSVFLGVLKR